MHTPIGAVNCTITQNDHIYVEGKNVVVSGKPLNFSLHLFLENGIWFDKRDSSGRTSFYCNKADKFLEYATPTQRVKVLANIIPAVSTWVTPEMLKEAQKIYINNKVDNLREKREELAKELASLDAQIAELTVPKEE